jgi:hypothetical protein
MGEPKSDGQTSRIDRFKTWVETIQGIATIIAIVAGGYWFFLQRSDKPEVKLDQVITQRGLEGESDQILITLDVRATNTGKTRVDLSDGELDLTQLNPTPGVSLHSYPLKVMTLEPGESDQALFRAVILPNAIRTIQLHTFYRVPGQTNEYWNLLSVADIDPTPDRKKLASPTHR